MTTEGIEDAGQDDPFAAVLFFRGKVTDDVRKNTLTATMPELRDDYEVADSSQFEVGQWYAVEVNALAGRWERELQRLVQITQIVDATHVRVNYKAGWSLAKGRTLTWTRVEPVEQVHVRNLAFRGRPDGDQYTGSHPIAYEYAVRCDVENVHGVATFWPLVLRRWSTFFRTAGCSLTNPASVTWGGAGYLTQQIYCNYGHVVDCHDQRAAPQRLDRVVVRARGELPRRRRRPGPVRHARPVRARPHVRGELGAHDVRQLRARPGVARPSASR